MPGRLAPLALPRALAPKTEGKPDCSAVVETPGSDDASGLGTTRRDSIVCFFDGANPADLLLEASSFVGVPDNLMPRLAQGFPHGFPGLSEDVALQLLDALGCFMRSLGGEAVPASHTEMRHELCVDATGRRIVRKALAVNGEVRISEERRL